MTSIYELTGEIQELERRLELADEMPSDIEQTEMVSHYLTLAEIEGDFADKIDAYVAVYRDLQARAQAQRAEAKNLTDMAKANENNMDRLKEAVKYASEKLGRSKLQGHTHHITVSTSGRPAIDIVDADKVPQEFLEVVKQIKIDKKAIADYLVETGEIVDGVETRKITTVRFS